MYPILLKPPWICPTLAEPQGWGTFCGGFWFYPLSPESRHNGALQMRGWHYGDYEEAYYQAFDCVHLFVHVVICSKLFPQSTRALWLHRNILRTVIWCREKSPGRAWRSKQSHKRLSLFSGDKHSQLWSGGGDCGRDGRGAQKGWNLCGNKKISMIFRRSHRPNKQKSPSRGERRDSYFIDQVKP